MWANVVHFSYKNNTRTHDRNSIECNVSLIQFDASCTIDFRLIADCHAMPLFCIIHSIDSITSIIKRTKKIKKTLFNCCKLAISRGKRLSFHFVLFVHFFLLQITSRIPQENTRARCNFKNDINRFDCTSNVNWTNVTIIGVVNTNFALFPSVADTFIHCRHMMFYLC